MAILPIHIYGDKLLKEKAKKVKKIDDKLIVKIKNMFDTMRNANGIGLAANQVGYEESVFVIDVSLAEGYEKVKPIVVINPQVILESDEKVIMEEGCLSLPDIRADVERSEKIKIRFIDTDENEVELEADDLYARVLLHEYDHLIGKTIPDRLSYIVRKKLQKELRFISDRDIDVDYPITEKLV
jgi:peptide deformylase